MENKGELSTNAAGDMTVRVQGTLKTALILKLRGLMQAYEQEPEDVKAELADITEYLDRHLIEIKSIKPKKAGKKQEALYTYAYSAGAYEGQTLEQVKQEVNRRLSSAVVTWAVSSMTGRDALFFKHIRKLESQLQKQQQRTRIKQAPQINENILRVPGIQQRDLFSSLDSEIQAQIVRQTGDSQNAIIYINQKGQGIKLSPDEMKMIQVIQELLHEKSQNTDEKRADYFIGNPLQESGNGVVTRAGMYNAPVQPKLQISVTEAARKFSGQDRPGGREQATAKRIITEMATNPDKHCLMQFQKSGNALAANETRRGKRQVLKKTETLYAPLWTISQIDWQMDDGKTDRELYLTLHEIFRTGIEDRAILGPPLDAIYAAYGSSNVPNAVLSFIRLLGEAHTHIKTKTKIGEGRRSHEIGQIKLFQQIAPENVRQKKKRYARVHDLLTKGIETAKKLGMIDGVSTHEGKSGDLIYSFELREGWRSGGDTAVEM